MARKDPEARREWQRAWRKANPERVLAQLARQREKQRGVNRDRHRENERKYRRKYLYGLTAETYDALLRAQDGKCAMCEFPPPAGKTLHVDHDHATGAVRGLLCAGCNIGLGAYETPGFIQAAKRYLTPASLAVAS